MRLHHSASVAAPPARVALVPVKTRQDFLPHLISSFLQPSVSLSFFSIVLQLTLRVLLSGKWSTFLCLAQQVSRSRYLFGNITGNSPRVTTPSPDPSFFLSSRLHRPSRRSRSRQSPSAQQVLFRNRCPIQSEGRSAQEIPRRRRQRPAR